jgi:hypothetical protein
MEVFVTDSVPPGYDGLLGLGQGYTRGSYIPESFWTVFRTHLELVPNQPRTVLIDFRPSESEATSGKMVLGSINIPKGLTWFAGSRGTIWYGQACFVTNCHGVLVKCCMQGVGNSIIYTRDAFGTSHSCGPTI